MTDVRSELNTKALAADAGEQAIILFERALASVSTQNKAAQTDSGTRLFFPSGIELITIQFDVGTSVKIRFTVAGKEAEYGPENSLLLDNRDLIADGDFRER